MLKLVKTKSGDVYVLYKKIRSLYWFSLKKNYKKVDNSHFLQLPFTANKSGCTEVYQRNGVVHLLIISEEQEIHELVLDESEETVTYLKKIEKIKVIPDNPLSVIQD